jgi:hypothetical protein
MPKSTPKSRSLAAKIAVSSRWGNTADWVAATDHLREARDQKFRDEVTASIAAQGIVLSDEEIERRAVHLRRAHMLRLSARSAEVRAAKRAATE